MITQRFSVMRRDSIRSKILVFAVLAALLPSLATAWFSYLENKRALTAKASEELASVSTQAARELELWTRERRYELRVFASSYEVTENLEQLPRFDGKTVRAGRAYQHLTDYLKSVHERFADYDELVVLDPQGRIVASSGEQPNAVALPADWQAQMRSDDLVLGAPYWEPSSGRPAMHVAVPIRIGSGRFLGALTAKVNLRTVAETLQRFAPGESGQIYLITEDGRLIVSSGQNSATTMSSRHVAPAVGWQLALDGRVLEFASMSGAQVFGSMRSVPELDWIAVAEIPTSDVFRQLAHLRNVTLLIVAGMLLVAWTLGYALSLFIVRPLDRLTRGAAKVAAGDLDVDLPVATGGEVGYLTEVFNDMVARLRAGRIELERLSVTDPLTGLYNRRRMMEALENEVRRSRLLQRPFAVLMADVDHFKQYNDAHGHPAGDEVLKRVAELLLQSTRDVDFVARYGGEEFFVLIPETRVRGASDVANRVRQQLAAEPQLGDVIRLSFGIAEFPAHGGTGEELIGAADAALYQAKREGRDQVVVADVLERAKAAG